MQAVPWTVNHNDLKLITLILNQIKKYLKPPKHAGLGSTSRK